MQLNGKGKLGSNLILRFITGILLLYITMSISTLSRVGVNSRPYVIFHTCRIFIG